MYYLHGVVGVLVVEDEGLLDVLVISLQLVDVGLVVDDNLFKLLHLVHLLLQGTTKVHRVTTDLLERNRQGDGGRENERKCVTGLVLSF